MVVGDAVPNCDGDLEQIRIRLASAAEIRGWSSGEVTRAVTVDPRSGKPLEGGLFCPKIFGPQDKWTRTPRMGHIELAAPVVHVWAFRIAPSRLAVLLDLPPALVAALVYERAYVTMEQTAAGLLPARVVSEKEYESLRSAGAAPPVVTGAEAIRLLLARLDLPRLANELRAALAWRAPQAALSKQRRVQLQRRLELVESLAAEPGAWSHLVLECLPVVSPALRPMLLLPGKSLRLATHDLNAFYAHVIRANERLRGLIAREAPASILRAERRRLQTAVDALFDNDLCPQPLCDAANRPLKSLGFLVKGKTGRFRQSLLGKRVDYSGRAVIVCGPELKLHQCGLPKTMARELFRPKLLGRLVRLHGVLAERHGQPGGPSPPAAKRGPGDERLAEELDRFLAEHPALVAQTKTWLAQNPLAWAMRQLAQPSDWVWDLLDALVREHPVLLNRAPTLHRMNLQAFRPVLTDGNAIRLHPLTCAGFGADFDGDTMAVHVPLSHTAIDEAETLTAAHNLFSPANGRLTLAPSQDMVLGCYYLTYARDAKNPTAPPPSALPHFAAGEEALLAYATKCVQIHDAIVLRLEGGRAAIEETASAGQPPAPAARVTTTVGRVAFNDLLPAGMPFFNVTMTARRLAEVIETCHRLCGRDEAVRLLDRVKELGFRAATQSGLSFLLDDLLPPANKEAVIARAQREDARIRAEVNNPHERRERLAALWRGAQQEMTERLIAQMRDDGAAPQPGATAARLNTLYAMTHSGARSRWVQVRQLAALRGLMARASGPHPTLERPILSSLRDGLATWEFFLSVHGARKAGEDKLNLPDSGYLTRQLADVGHHVVVTQADCGAATGIVFREAAADDRAPRALAARVVGRVSCREVREETGAVLLAAGEWIAPGVARRLAELGLRELEVRSPLTCLARPQVCQRCYGSDPATRRLVARGTAVGMVAAQSIGEPGVQLGMMTKHTGGVAERDTGLERVLRLFQSPHQFVSAELLAGSTGERAAPPRAVDLQVALRELLQQVYRECGIAIDDKHFEVILAQMCRYERIVAPGDTPFYPGERVTSQRLQAENQRLEQLARRAPPAAPRRPAVAVPVLTGVGQAALASESFLSAASFERGHRVLLDAALAGRVDPLRGLKENVMLGRPIPAGTGFQPGMAPPPAAPKDDFAPFLETANLMPHATAPDPGATPFSPEKEPLENYAEASDERLMSLYYDDHDAAAFDELDRRYRERLAMVAFRRLGRVAGRRQLADELAAAALAKAADTRGKRHGAWDRQRPLAPWLFGILRHAVFDHQRLKPQQPFTGLERPDQEVTLADALRSDAATPEEHLLARESAREQHAALDEFLATLPPPLRVLVIEHARRGLTPAEQEALDLLARLPDEETRAIIVERHWEGLTQQEMAEILGVSPSHVSKKLKAFYEHLTEHLERRGFDAPAPRRRRSK